MSTHAKIAVVALLVAAGLLWTAAQPGWTPPASVPAPELSPESLGQTEAPLPSEPEPTVQTRAQPGTAGARGEKKEESTLGRLAKGVRSFFLPSSFDTDGDGALDETERNAARSAIQQRRGK